MKIQSAVDSFQIPNLIRGIKREYYKLGAVAMAKHIAKHFPVQKGITSVPTEPRRDRGANNKRLPCSEAALVAFTAPIAGTQPEVHETSEPTRDGKGVPRVVPCGQLLNKEMKGKRV